MTPEQAQEKALDRIKAVASAGGDTLELGDLPLISLPDEIFELKTLRILILGAGRYDAARDALMMRKEKVPVQRPLINLTGLDRLTYLRHLDLSKLLHVTAIPEVHALKFLTSLNLQGCTSLSALPELQNLTQLKALNLHGCTSLSSLPELRNLTQLTWLSLQDVARSTGIPGLQYLAQLTSLQLSGFTRLTALPELQKPTQLTSLNLQDLTSLTELPQLQKLTQLTSLTLQGLTSLTQLPGLETLEKLTSLTVFNCTRLTALPELQQLTKLTSLSLQGFTSLSELPALETLDKLTAVNIGGCAALTSLPSLASLRALTTLRLQGCRALESLPDFGANGSLALINVEACGSLGSFSPLQPLLKTLSELYLHGTYFDDLPAELCGSDSSDNVLPGVRAHFAARNQQGDHEDRECKILILGNGRVGKTSLAKQLVGQPHDPKELSTHGIQLWTWEPKIQLQDDNEPGSVRVNIWDFGGQDLYHNTHRLFISSRAVFVLVWEATSPSCGSGDADVDPLDKKRPMTYWLDQVHSIHRDPQIIIVRTKIDLADALNATWHDKVPEKYRGLPSIDVSSADRTTVGTENLQRAIAAAIGQELGPKTNRLIGDGRWRVKSRLRKLQAANDLLMRDKKQPSCPTLTTDQLQEMVSEECANTDDALDPQWLLRYLHDTGVIYHRRDLFSGLVIVEQRWVIIYTIFNPGICRDHLLQSRGRFRASQLNEWAWSEKGFTEEQQRLMVWFMYSCRICFILLKAEESAYGENIYVATYYLPKRHLVEDDIAELLDPFAKEPVASLTAEHLFLGESLMGGFLVRLGDLFSRLARFWKNGAAFVASHGKVAATVEWMPIDDSSFGGRLRIQTFGDAITAPSVMTQIRNTFQFQPGFPEGLRWTREVWPYAPDLELEVATETDGRQLEEPSPSERIRPIVGISRASERSAPGSKYNEYNEPGIGTLPGLLYHALLRRSRSGSPFTVLIDDADHAYSAIPELMDQLAKGDFVFVFLSKRYLFSKYCCYELMSIYKADSRPGHFFKERIKLLRYPSGTLSNAAAKRELNNYWEAEAKQFNEELRKHEADPLETMDIADASDSCVPWFRFSNAPNNRWELIGAIGRSIWEDLPQPIPDDPTADELQRFEELVDRWALEADKKLTGKSFDRE